MHSIAPYTRSHARMLRWSGFERRARRGFRAVRWPCADFHAWVRRLPPFRWVESHAPAPFRDSRLCECGWIREQGILPIPLLVLAIPCEHQLAPEWQQSELVTTSKQRAEQGPKTWGDSLEILMDLDLWCRSAF